MKKIYVFLSAMLVGTGVFAQGETCATAEVITGNGVISTDGPSSGGGAIGSGATNADWYSFTPTCDGNITVSSCGFTGDDTRLYIYEGTCPAASFSEITGNDDFCGLQSQASTAVTGGTTYFIEWTDRWGDDAPFDFAFTYTAAGGITGINQSNLTAVGVDLDWTPVGAETAWEIEYGPAGFTQGSGTVVAVTGTPDEVLTGLNPETAYDVYIGINGDACSYSMASFTTLPLCPVPTAPMSTPGATDAALSWTQGGIEVLWDVEYGPAGFVLGDGTMDDNLGAPNDAVTGLTGSTNYHWYVRAVCDVNTTDGVDTVSYWVGPESFMTAPTCPAPTNFTATLVDTFEMDLQWDAGGLETSWIIEYGPTGFAQGSGTSFTVSTSSDTLIDGLDPETDYDFYLYADCGSGDMSTVVGPVMETTGIACSEVSGLNISGLTTSSVNMNWTAGSTETEWNVVYGENGFDPLTEGTTENVMTTPTLAVTGLDAGTSYQFYVEAVCGVDTNSVWVGPFTFSTVISCPQPTNLTVMNITNTAANLLFQAGGSETEWNIEWGSTGFTPDNGEEFGSVSGTTDNPYYATGLNASSTYEYYVQASCGAGDESTWAGPFQFNTLLANDMPCNAIEITVDAADTNRYVNFGATVDANEPTLGGSIGGVTASTWFMFTAPASGVVTVSTSDVSGMTTTSTDIGVFSATDCGVYSTYTLEGASNTPGTGGTGAELTLCGLTGGQTYYVMVDPRFGATDDFMIAVNSEAAANAGTAVSGISCSADGSVDLFDFVTGFSDDNGSFYFPDATQTDPGLIFAGEDGSLVLTGLDTMAVYPFDYVVGSGCNMDVVSIQVVYAAQPNAGGDGMATTCIGQNVDLFDQLVGVVPTGGVWSDDDNATGLVNGVLYTGAVAEGTYEFTYLLDNGICADSSMVEVTVESCLGVDANETASLEVYPNPVQNELTIANLNVEGQAVITVVDVQGKVVMTADVSNVNGNFNLDMSNLENGVYVVTVRTNDSVENVRVVKQ